MGRLAFPVEILQAEAQETLDYLILRFALERDVRVVVGNNAGRLVSLLEQANRRRDELVQDIAAGTVSGDLSLDPALASSLPLRPNPERARLLAAGIAASGRLAPRDFWPGLRLACFWLSGSVGRYMAGLEPWLPPGVARMDVGYGASEAKLNVPLAPDRSAAPPALHGQFLEFLPLDGGGPRMAHELEDGAAYRLLLTTYSGLYRYDIHDVVRVDGFTAGCPDIVFEGKSGDVGNIAGERLTGPVLLRVVGGILAGSGLTVRHWCAATDVDRHGYDLCLELSPDSAPPGPDLPLGIDSALRAGAFAYGLLRGQAMLGPLRVRLMGKGWLERLYEQKMRSGVSTSQMKLPVVVPAVPLPEMTERTLEQEP